MFPLSVPRSDHMPYRREERDYHTRLGWWLMTHDRGGVALIGGGALVLLTADVVYVGLRWRGLHDRFDRGFIAGVVVLMAPGCSPKCSDSVNR